MIKLGIATLAGGITIALFLGQSTSFEVSPFAFAWLTSGFALSLLSLLFLVDAYVGIVRPRDFYIGPDLNWANSKAKDPSWTLPDYLASLLASYPVYRAQNHEGLVKAINRRRNGVKVLIIAVVVYGGAMAFIFGGL